MRQIILGLYIGLLVGMTLISVGKPVECKAGDKHDRGLPITMFFMIATPAILGYEIGKSKNDQE